MEEFIDRDLVHRSTEFVVDHLIHQPNYNYFNDPEQKLLVEHNWRQLVANENQDESLTNNRRRLAFLISNYHIITPENRYSKLEEWYILSDYYKHDLRATIKVLNILIIRILISNDVLTKPVLNLFELSSRLAVPMPGFTAIVNNNKKRKEEAEQAEEVEDDDKQTTMTGRKSNFTLSILTDNYTNVAGIFNDYNQISPKIDEMNNSYIENKIKEFKIDKSFLLKENEVTLRNPIGSSSNEAGVSEHVSSYLISPVQKYLDSTFNNVHILTQSGLNPKVKPDFVLAVEKDAHVYYTTIEIKIAGIEIAYNKRNERGNKKFINLFNQIIYQMVTCETSLGFGLDQETLLIVEICETSIEKRTDVFDGFKYELNCRIGCFKHSNSDYNISFLLLLFTSTHFSSVDESEKQAMKALLKDVELTEEDKRLNWIEQEKFMTKEWESHFSSFNNTGKSFVHKIHSEVILDKDLYDEIKYMNFNHPIFDESDFEITGIMQGGILSKNKYYSQVRRIRFKSGSNAGIDMILKVYNPISAPKYNGISQMSRFLHAYSFSLSNFLTEVTTYKELRDTQANGYLEIKPDTTRVNGQISKLNVVPYLYQYGFIKLSKQTELQGFYLLQEYIEDSSESLTPEELYSKSLKSLAIIQDHQIIHNDLHRDNILYHAGKDRVYIIDFGQSYFVRKFPFFKCCKDGAKLEEERAVLKLECQKRKQRKIELVVGSQS
ncbi:uncharacterized protein RJT21DRAFT_9691 [Scheffersomyces amazonensis]|uniref:uncharacterized protein n=1 Tax=Scheffersomyces amazonensis TaxID=1078765 RepID=UPI00315DE8D1